MADLSETRRKLIDVAMANDEPPSADESWGALVSRLTSDGSRGAAVLGERASPASRSLRWIAAAVASAAIVTVVAVWSSSSRRGDPSAAEVPREPEPARVEPAAPRAGKAGAVRDEPSADRLLTDAEAALDAGDPARALTLLQRHAELAAIDARAPQRMALRILALCAKGDREAARREANAFLAAHGRSEWADRVRRSCGGDPR